MSTCINWSSLSLPTPRMRGKKQVLHGLCSSPTGKTELLLAVQILLLSLRNKRTHYHRPTSTAQWWEISERGAFVHDVKFGVSSKEMAVFHNIVAQLDTQLLWWWCCCINQHKCLYSVPATKQKRPWLCFIFNDNVLAAVRVSLCVCANHFTSDCFSNACQ